MNTQDTTFQRKYVNYTIELYLELNRKEANIDKIRKYSNSKHINYYIKFIQTNFLIEHFLPYS